MGGGSSVVADADHFRDIFVNEGLADAEVQFSTDATLRACFIDFVKNGDWATKLVVTEDIMSDSSTKSAWNGFGYAFPVRSEAGPKPSIKSASSFQTITTLVSEFSSRASSFRGSGKPVKELDSLSSWLVCQNMEDARTIVLVALTAMFYSSTEFQQWCSPSFSDENNSVSTFSDPRAVQTVKEPLPCGRNTTRLRELFQSAVASASVADFDAYLANPMPRLVTDFRRVVTNLPLRINICKAQGSAKAKAPQVLFGTSGKLGAPPLSSAKSMRSEKIAPGNNSNSELGSEKYLDLPQLYSPDYTPEQRELVETALAKNTGVKLAVRTAYDKCTLQAIRPVRAANGVVHYVMSVEAVDKVVVSQVSNPHYNPVAFQQVEDLLLLLPLLIKTE